MPIGDIPDDPHPGPRVNFSPETTELALDGTDLAPQGSDIAMGGQTDDMQPRRDRAVDTPCDGTLQSDDRHECRSRLIGPGRTSERTADGLLGPIKCSSPARR